MQSSNENTSVHYSYHRTSTYDPNLCSTAARLSPPPNHLVHINHHNATEQQHNQNGQLINDNYGNIILVPCNHDDTQLQHQHQQQQQQNNVRGPNAILTDFGAYQILQESNQISYNNYDDRPFISNDDVNHHHLVHNNHNHRTHYHHHLLNDDLNTKNSVDVHAENSLHCHYTQAICNENSIQYSAVNLPNSTPNNINTAVPDNSQIILHRNYQNYYVNNDEIDETTVAASIVEIVQAVRNEINNQNSHSHYHQNNHISNQHHVHHNHHQYIGDNQHNSNDNNDNIEFRASQNSASTLMSNFSEANFVTIEPSFITQHELIDNYESMTTPVTTPVTSNNDHHHHHHHHHHPSVVATANETVSSGTTPLDQRYLLRRTISPLLAAVNDIAQRDAELQSYLNQADRNANETTDIDNVFQMDEIENNKLNEKDEYDQNKEYLDINEVKEQKHEADKKENTNLKERKLNLRKKNSHSKIENNEDNEDGNCLLISDKPVESRARASLPTNYLYFVRNHNDIDKAYPIVCAKREIPFRTKFGPFEGEIRLTDDSVINMLQLDSSRDYPSLLLGENKVLEVSNDNTSNWMKFVRLAKIFDEQNLLLIEDDDEKLYFRCFRTINPKEELRVGYSEEYAVKYNLNFLKPNDEEKEKLYDMNNPWPCFECDERFQTSAELQNHLNVHDSIDNEFKNDDVITDESKKRKRIRKYQQQHNNQFSMKRLPRIQKNSIRCFYCLKVFMTSASLKKHIAGHVAEKRSKKNNNKKGHELICNSTIGQIKCCYRKFSSEEKLKKHRLVHLKNEIKTHKCPECNRNYATQTALSSHLRSHSKNSQRFHCAYCSEQFKKISELRNHVVNHSVNGIYPCHLCGKKYREYNFARKHIRVFHPGVTHSCTICGRQFAYMNALKRHMSCHSDKKEFLCSECGQQFKRRDKLKAHVERIHSENRKQMVKMNKKQIQTAKEKKSLNVNVVTRSQHLKLTPKKASNKVKTTAGENLLNDYERYFFKCHQCRFGFKRRGMLINHMAKRHPEIEIESIPELNLPILKQQSVYFCPYCTKSYKNNSKRKIHILKSHPGQELPPSARNNPKELLNVRYIGSIETDPHRCQWCYKQYTTRNRLLLHYKKEHENTGSVDAITREPIAVASSGTLNPMEINENDCNDHFVYDQDNESHEYQNGEQFIEQFYHNHSLPPHSPENKLLKLSSAALELSSIEDRKFFDFLNERSQDTALISMPMEMRTETSTEIINHHPTSTSAEIISTDDSANTNSDIPFNNDDNATDIDEVHISRNSFPKVGCSFKIEEENEFSETSSVNTTLNKLPQLFEGSIACI